VLAVALRSPPSVLGKSPDAGATSGRLLPANEGRVVSVPQLVVTSCGKCDGVRVGRMGVLEAVRTLGPLPEAAPLGTIAAPPTACLPECLGGGGSPTCRLLLVGPAAAGGPVTAAYPGWRSMNMPTRTGGVQAGAGAAVGRMHPEGTEPGGRCVLKGCPPAGKTAGGRVTEAQRLSHGVHWCHNLYCRYTTADLGQAPVWEGVGASPRRRRRWSAPCLWRWSRPSRNGSEGSNTAHMRMRRGIFTTIDLEARCTVAGRVGSACHSPLPEHADRLCPGRGVRRARHLHIQWYEC
jgi:hypothetical protein